LEEGKQWRGKRASGVDWGRTASPYNYAATIEK
jgi:hypothetical protein